MIIGNDNLSLPMRAGLDAAAKPVHKISDKDFQLLQRVPQAQAAQAAETTQIIKTVLKILGQRQPRLA